MGVVINFFIEDSKVHFEINLKAAEQDNIQISAQLVRLGRIVSGEQTAGGP